MRWSQMTLAGLFGLLMTGAAFAGEPTECDRLAGSPTDPNRVGTGIGLYWIEPAEAVSACEKALSTDPNNLRLLFDLGRAHEAAMFLSGFLPGSTQAADSWVGKCKPDGRQATVSASIRHGTVKPDYLVVDLYTHGPGGCGESVTVFGKPGGNKVGWPKLRSERKGCANLRGHSIP